MAAQEAAHRVEAMVDVVNHIQKTDVIQDEI
jgi:hypothetical protein